jgi:hypothetical protein
MLHQRRIGFLGVTLLLSASGFLVACADGVPIDELFPSDAGRSSPQSHAGSAGSYIGNDHGSAGGSSPTDTSGAGGSNDGGAGSTGTSGSNGSSGSSSGQAGASGGSAGAGGSGNQGGAHGGSSGGCSAPAWDTMTVYCGQGAVGTEVSLNGKKYACHYWTQAQNPEDHNSADNSEPWSTPSSCP